MTRRFGASSNPANIKDSNGNPVFTGPFKKNHTIPREVFS
jgi:hypothetical protein